MKILLQWLVAKQKKLIKYLYNLIFVNYNQNMPENMKGSDSVSYYINRLYWSCYKITSAWKPKAPSWSPAASYVQRWALCSNRPANVSMKWLEVVGRSYKRLYNVSPKCLENQKDTINLKNEDKFFLLWQFG